MSSWQYLLKNKRQLVKWLVAAIIPVVFVTGFLVTMGHTTQQASRLKVAVVNLDDGSRYRGKQQNIGIDFSRRLHNQKTFIAVNYPTKKQATSALRDGKINAIVVIPAALTSQLSDFQKSGKTVNLQQIIASGQSQFASQYLQRQLTQALHRENALLMVGTANSSMLKNLANQSQHLSQQANDLQTNLQAVGNGIDAQTASDLQSTAQEETAKLASYSAQLNDAISAGDTTKISKMASAINDVSYTMQTSVVGGISNMAANLNNTKSLSDESGIIQSSAKNIQQGQSDIAGKLKDTLGDQESSKNPSPLSQMMVFDMTDMQPIKQDGQRILATLLVIGVTLLSILFGLVLPIKSTKPEMLALEQWWRNFQVGGIMSVMSAMLMTVSAVFWQISLEKIFAITTVTLLAAWAMMSIVWYLKQVLGQSGWWLSIVLMIGQLIFTVTSLPSSVSTTTFNVIRSLLPLPALNRAINQLIFGGNVQQNVAIITLWLLSVTILLVTYYRVKQRQNLKEILTD
ncbi:hypothetical protein [uncultured Leuconostoc sp.]|uniref:YhgE/Pip domain-containing protein n=1 Tax=uncultured Leuconostoc sp. TaxID=173262 RepID=UPI0025F34E37|nr:hypothetical protein [uncultured Leuconostoc sp.]